jgi:hypothetical protein
MHWKSDVSLHKLSGSVMMLEFGAFCTIFRYALRSGNVTGNTKLFPHRFPGN